jgi:hypothetical protein
MVVDDLDVQPETMLWPTFDVLWNASGLPTSPNYDGDPWSRH